MICCHVVNRVLGRKNIIFENCEKAVALNGLAKLQLWLVQVVPYGVHPSHSPPSLEDER